METTAVKTARYVLDAKLSRFVVRVFASGIFSAFGHNPTIAIRDFKGEARLTPETIEPALIELKINAGSLEVADEISEKDRREINQKMRDEVLEIAKYPEIVFASSEAAAAKTGEGEYRADLRGNLSLHGVTRSQSLAAQLKLNGDTLRAFGELSLRQTDYSIKLVSAAAGGLKVRDEIKFSFDIVARRHE